MSNRDWFKTRPYLHFDFRLSNSDRAEVEAKVSDPKYVAQHRFLPFLFFTKDKPKFYWDATLNKRRFKMGFRPICYASHMDAQVYAYYSRKVSATYEETLQKKNLQDNVIAFRRILNKDTGEPMCNIHLANVAFDTIQRMGTCKALCFDIKSFFDSLDHKVLKQNWISLLQTRGLPEDHYALFTKLTHFKTVDRNKLFQRLNIPLKPSKQVGIRRICSDRDLRGIVHGEKFILQNANGIPQGSPISATLANIYMLPFDMAVDEVFRSHGGKFFRYCDDILCILPQNCGLDVENFIRHELQKLKLKINDDKTEISNFSNSTGRVVCDRKIQYLGFEFDGESKYIRAGSVASFRNEAKRAITIAVRTKKISDTKAQMLGLPKRPLHLKKFFRKKTHRGKRNFISYGRRAQKIMKSESIRRQLARLDKFLRREVKWAKSVT